MLQLLVPSREEHEGYRALLREIEKEISRINGRFGKPGLTPLEYMHTNLEDPELVALYRHANVMMVAPVRDGMNLVAQEYVACKGCAPRMMNDESDDESDGEGEGTDYFIASKQGVTVRLGATVLRPTWMEAASTSESESEAFRTI